MRSRNTRLTALLLTLLICVASLAGCGAKDSATPTDPTTPVQNSTEAQNTVEQSEPVELLMLSYENMQEEKHKKLIEEFEKKNPDLKVKIEYATLNDTAAYQTKMDTMILAGEPIDIVINTYIIDYVRKASDKMYYGLNQFIEKEGAKYSDIYKIDLTVNDDIYALPESTKSFIVYLNKNMLDEAGLSVPPVNWTWDDYREYAKKLTKGTGASKIYGSFMYNSWAHFFNLGLYSTHLGTPYYNDDKTINADDAGFLKYRWQLENEDKSQFPTSEVLASKLFQNDIFFSGKAAMVINGTWMIADVKNVKTYPHDFVTAFAMLPRGADAPEGRTVTEVRYLNIPVTSKHPYEAYRFARFYTTDGVNINGKGFSGAKEGADKSETIKIMTEENKSGLYDMDSLKSVITNPKWVDNNWIYCPTYTIELDQLKIETSNQYLTGGISYEQAIEQFKTEGQKVLDRNKK